jgi:orotate phosphoribosyltransferase
MDHFCSPEPSLRVERNKLIDDLKRLSVKRGEEFALSSGQKSNIYIDVKQTMLHGPSMHNLAKLLHNESNYLGWYDVVAGVPTGGTHLATMVAMYSPPMNVALIRKNVKDHGTQKIVEAPPMKQMRVVLFEDVVTTGESALKAAHILEQWDYYLAGIVAVVDRRAETNRSTLGGYEFRALVDMEELIED